MNAQSKVTLAGVFFFGGGALAVVADKKKHPLSLINREIAFNASFLLVNVADLPDQLGAVVKSA